MGEEFVRPVMPVGIPVNRSQRRQPVQLVVSVATLILVAGLLGFEIWKYYQPAWDGLPEKVRSSMNEFLSSDDDFSVHNPQVTTVTVMHAQGNVFEGQATVIASGIPSRDVWVHIMWDGETLLWRSDPGSFLFLAMAGS